MTNDDLKKMQAWPLERKIRVSQTRIMEWYHRWDGQVYVSFSGGKDSTVLLDLARRAFPDIEAVFCDTGLEYPEIRNFVSTCENVRTIKPKMRFDQVIEKYGYPVVSKEVARAVYYSKNGGKSAEMYMKKLNGKLEYEGKKSLFNMEKWKFLLDAPFKIGAGCCDIMKKSPLHVYEKKMKKKPIVGTMADEAFIRKQAWIRTGCNAFGGEHPQSKPLSFWTEQDILLYLKETGIEYCSVYGEIEAQTQETMPFVPKKLHTTGLKRTGCMFCMFGVHMEKEPNRFQKMKETHPKQYVYCIDKLECGEVLDYIGVKY